MKNRDENLSAWGGPLERGLLALVFGFVVVSLAGYATFGRHPSLVAGLPGAAEFYGIAFHFFPRGQALVAFGALALVLVYRAGWRWLGAFVAVYAVSLGAELLGTSTGFPFGAYAYGDALGVKWLDLVPALIPLSWFYMAVPSWLLARRLLEGRSGAARLLLGALLLAMWDLSLDPAMSHATAYWSWSETGSFYGMPWVNLVGWYVTGVALMAVLSWRALRVEIWALRLPLGWVAAFYAANVLLSWGMVVASGLLWAAVLTPVAYGLLLAALRPWDVRVVSIEVARAQGAGRDGLEG